MFVRTFFLQKDTTLGDHDGHITVDETFAVIVREGDGDIRIFDADVEGNTEYTLRFFCCKTRRISLTQGTGLGKDPSIKQSSFRDRHIAIAGRMDVASTINTELAVRFDELQDRCCVGQERWLATVAAHPRQLRNQRLQQTRAFLVQVTYL